MYNTHTLSLVLGIFLAGTVIEAQTVPSQVSVSPTTSKADAKSDTTTAVAIVDIISKQGKLPNVLKAEIAKAITAGRTPFVELGATWCGPCNHLKASLGDKRMIDAFSGTYIVHLDVDDWKGQLAPLGFVSNGIPAFFAIDANGKATGQVITGDAWGEDIPENMAPPLKEFFRANLRKS
jgi:hypothetical protein